MINTLPSIYTELFEERLFPCSIARDKAGKKQVKLPKGWNDSEKSYEDFDDSKANSVALRTGNGLIAVDIDTKNLTLLEPYMKELVSKWLNDKATFTVETTNGYHFYFDSGDKSYGNAVRISNYVDIRGDGGCVFCYTKNKDSSYTVLCEAEPLPLADELLNYISIQETDSKTIEYEFDASGIRIASTPHNPNKVLEKALYIDSDKERAIAILKACGKSVADFENTNELYSKTNSLAYILAMNPLYPNEDVRLAIEYIIKNFSGFDINSQESQKRLNQIFSTMIYSDESDMVEVEEDNIVVEIENDSDLVKKIDYTLPKELVKCNELYKYLNKCDYKTHPLASLTALFTIASAITARGYYTHTRCSTNLFMILIAKTGAGKNNIVKIPNTAMKILKQQDKIITSKISSEGAMDDIFKYQTSAIQIADEFGDLLGHMLNDKGGYLQAVASKMKMLYSLSNGTYNSGRYSSAGGKHKTANAWSLEHPCYGLVGLTTQAQLLINLKDNMLHDGFINRFIILNGQDIKPVFHDNPLFDIPIAIEKHIKSIKISRLIYRNEDGDVVKFTNLNANGIKYFKDEEYQIVKLSSDANEYYNKFIGDADIKNSDIYSYCKNDETEVKRAMSVRWRENSIRLAVALTAYEKQEEVSLEILQWCYQLVKNSSINFLALFDKESNKTKYGELKDKAKNWFKNQVKDKYFSKTHLAQNARPFSTLKAQNREELLNDLVESKFLEHKQNRVDKQLTHLYKMVS